MSEIKRADQIHIFLCDHCAAVHIGFIRNGRMFAEAIPIDVDQVAADLKKSIAESRERQSGASPAKH